ncbi:MAG TPA: FAD-dependent oxidoreductase [Streptosporangiaceae bacterium]|nr:FAD-dependent oxidoreductase [Streptosporangiaceae bacterium]
MGLQPYPAILAASAAQERRDEFHDALDLRYGSRYKVFAAASMAEADEVLAAIHADGRRLALVLSELTLADGPGLRLLEAAKGVHPAAKRVLIADGRDAGVAIEAINRVRLDRYLVNPVTPAAERLYPDLDDLIAAWEAEFGDHHAELRVLGHRFAAQAHEIKDFLARNLVPFHWLGVDDMSGEGRLLADSLGLSDPVPTTVLLENGTALREPSLTELAEAIGLAEPVARHFYELVVVGGGPAGMAAGVYAACEGWRVLIVEQHAPGGQAGTTSRIENYLGFPSGLTGGDLARRGLEQARKFGVEWAETRPAVALKAVRSYHVVVLADGTEIACRAVVVATGMQWRKLPLPGVDRLVNRGVYYGACLSESADTAGEDIFMVGSGNSAGQAALHFAQDARTVTLLVREPSLRAGAISAYLADRLESHPGVVIRPHTDIADVAGEDRLTGLMLRDTGSGDIEQVPAASLYVLIGAVPCTQWLDGTVAMTDDGYILTGDEVKGPQWSLPRDPLLTETSLPGVLAIGDVRSGSVKRVGGAVGEGAAAVQAVAAYLRGSGVAHPVPQRRR